MVNKLFEFKQWLLEKRNFRMAWFAKDPQITPEPEEALARLPHDIAEELLVAVNDLPPHPVEQASIIEALNHAIIQWREKPHLANNSIVILAHPVSSVARILTEGLHELRAHKSEPISIKLLDWIERPLDSKSIKDQIKEKLRWNNADFPDEEKTDQPIDLSEEKRKHHNLAVIPNLCWCFLRSAEGLDGVDYLQDTLLSDRTQFWVIGSGQVGWEYLKSTLKLHAYCGDTVELPALTGEQLQDWLKPVVKQFDIHFSDAALHKRLSNPHSLLEMDVSINQIDRKLVPGKS